MAISKEHFKDLSIEEMAQDDYFIQSLKSPTPESEKFWQEFLLNYPYQKEVLYEARQLASSLNFQSVTIPTGKKEALWSRITAEAAKPQGKVVKITNRPKWMWAAAVVAGIIMITVASLLIRNDSKAHLNTQFSEVKQYILPDQSIVTLNANSSIEFKKEWKKGQPREVWLNGEAFFEVKHLHQPGTTIQDHERFIVHAGETNVEVLGTTFNVSDRKAITEVMLQTGSVRINFKDKNTPSVLMTPGEVVKYDQQSKRLVKEVTINEKYISWKKKEFLLDNTTVEEIVNVIENTFGYKVVIEGQDLLKRQLSGTGKVSLENEETLFKSLELLLEVTISKKDDTLYIKKI